MMISPSDPAPSATTPAAAGTDVNPQGAAQIQVERARKGITQEMLEQRRRESLQRPF